MTTMIRPSRQIADPLNIRKQLAADFPTRSEFRQELAASQNNLGSLLRDTGQLQEAEANYTAALSIQKQLAADFPIWPDFRRDLASSYGNRGMLLSSTGRPQEGWADYTEALSGTSILT